MFEGCGEAGWDGGGDGGVGGERWVGVGVGVGVLSCVV